MALPRPEIPQDRYRVVLRKGDYYILDTKGIKPAEGPFSDRGVAYDKRDELELASIRESNPLYGYTMEEIVHRIFSNARPPKGAN